MLDGRTNDNGHKLEQGKFWLDTSLKKNMSRESGKTLEHIAQRGCGGVSILREIQNPPGHGPFQPLGFYNN